MIMKWVVAGLGIMLVFLSMPIGNRCFGVFRTGDLMSYQKMDMKPADVMPARNALVTQKPQVIVFDVDGVTWSGGGPIIRDQLQRAIADAGAIIIDRSLAGSLQNELELAEVRGATGYQGQAVADYAITGKIVRSDIIEAVSAAEGKKGVAANLSILLRVSRIPSLQQVKVISVDARSAVESLPADRSVMLSDAARKAVIKSQTDFKNLFAQTGYVLEHRVSGTVHVFRSTLSIDSGARPGLTVSIFRIQSETNPLSGEVSEHEVKIADGEITDQVSENASYFYVKKMPVSDSIRLGDKVRIYYRPTWRDYIEVL